MPTFTYEFEFEDQTRVDIEVNTETPLRRTNEPAEWTKLEFQQCRNCPLKGEDLHCPVAVDLQQVTEKFSDIISYSRARVRVITPERTYEKECDAQAGLKSLLGLIMAASDCPILSQLRPMARYHLPFSSVEETIYRTAGAYLLKQYYISQVSGEPDMDLTGLENLYKSLQIVNTDFLQRVRVASNEDANLNAISTLFALSAMVSMTLKEQLEEIKPLFFKRTGTNS